MNDLERLYVAYRIIKSGKYEKNSDELRLATSVITELHPQFHTLSDKERLAFVTKPLTEMLLR